jgi:hypothetical protein
MISMRTVSRAVALAAIVIAAHAFAAAKARAVRPVTEGVYTAAVLDSASGKPVIEAEVKSGNRTVKTDARGAFSILVTTGRPIPITIHRSGYDDLTIIASLPAIPTPTPPGVIISPAVPPTPAPVPPVAGPPVLLIPRLPVTVKMTNGQTVSLDADTIQFAYVIPFSSPATSTSASFCRVDGTAFNPERSEIARIVGPTTTITNADCCKLGPVMSVNVELRSGEKAQVFFTDSCFGYDVTIGGRERDSAQFVYLKFNEIASVEFP